MLVVPLSGKLVQEIIARMEAEIEAVRWLVYYVSDLKTKRLPHAKEISSAKWLASELAVRVSAEAIRLHGAYGCTDSHVAPGLQEAAAETFDKLVSPKYNDTCEKEPAETHY